MLLCPCKKQHNCLCLAWQLHSLPYSCLLHAWSLHSHVTTAASAADFELCLLCSCCCYRWSGEAEAVLLHQLPHRHLTRPVKLLDFDFCSPAGSLYPTGASVQLEVTAAGRVNAVVMWFDLHLAEGVALTSGEAPSCCSTAL